MANFMKNAVYVLAVLGIIASIILGVISKSFWTAVGGCIATFISFIPWFLLVEISDKVDMLSEQLARAERTIKVSTAEQISGSTPDSGYSLSSLAYAAKGSNIVGGKWTCPKCKEPNPSSQRVCKSCGYNR